MKASESLLYIISYLQINIFVFIKIIRQNSEQLDLPHNRYLCVMLISSAFNCMENECENGNASIVEITEILYFDFVQCDFLLFNTVFCSFLVWSEICEPDLTIHPGIVYKSQCVINNKSLNWNWRLKKIEGLQKGSRKEKRIGAYASRNGTQCDIIENWNKCNHWWNTLNGDGIIRTIYDLRALSVPRSHVTYTEVYHTSVRVVLRLWK